MKNKLIIVAITLVIALCLCACVSTSGSFSYVHDPRLNAEAMKDIVENPDAVYGFSPNPQSKRLGTYVKYDWTDPKFVADAKKQRIEYNQSLQTMYDMLNKMTAAGEAEEKIARTISAERNRLRLATYENDPQGLADVKKSNLETYGHEDGPTADEMFAKYGSWSIVIQKAFSTNMGMDACCGLYDDYYPEYVKMGYVEE